MSTDTSSDHNADTPRHAALAALSWLVDMGADEAISETALDRFAAAPQQAAQTTRASSVAPTATSRSAVSRSANQPVASALKTPIPPPRARTSQQITGTLEDARKAANAADTLDALANALVAFDGFAKRATCRNPVVGQGPAGARLALLVKAPTHPEEDQQARLFVGQTAQLVVAMMRAIKLDLDTDIRSLTLVPWREPGGRDHSGETYRLYSPFMMRHLSLVAPRVIISFGTAPAQQILGSTDSIGRLRGKPRQIELAGGSAHLVTTHHPDSLIHQPQMKAMVWQDLLLAQSLLEDR